MNCRRCDRDFIWAVTEKGRRMPVDPEPRPDGNLALWRDGAGVLRCRVVTAAAPREDYEHPGMPHAATCAPPRQGVPTTADGLPNLNAYRRQRNTEKRRTPR